MNARQSSPAYCGMLLRHNVMHKSSKVAVVTFHMADEKAHLMLEP